MTTKQLDRLFDILDRAVKVAERWADREYPVPDENLEATISRVGDRPFPNSEEEYKALEEPIGRFEALLRDRSRP